ncbi:MAG: peptidoglycan DD-metalloendopeptidase family protein [Bradymonadia bacterium]
MAICSTAHARARGLLVAALWAPVLALTTACGEQPAAAPDAAAAVAIDAAVIAAPTSTTPPSEEAVSPDASLPADAATPQSPIIVNKGKIQRGQAVATALKSHGLTSADVAQIVKALEGVYDFRRARPGSPYEIKRQRADGALVRFRFQHGPLEIYEVKRGDDGILVGGPLKVETRTEIISRGANIESSLYAAMKAAGEEPGLVALVVDVFAWDIDFFKQTRKGDTFRVVAEKIFVADKFIRYGRILAAQYEGKVGSFKVFWFAPGGDDTRGEYYLEDGRSARKSFLATPLKFTRVSSGFGKRRHPVLGYTKKHNGVDYAAPRGTPVWAMAAGKVTWAGRKGPSGILVRIDHQNGLQSAYAHLNGIAKGVKRGTYVRQKQIIGYVGTTGRSTGPHLHFGVKRNGRWINPTSLKMTRGRPVGRKHKRAFKALVKERGAQLAGITTRRFEEPPGAVEVQETRAQDTGAQDTGAQDTGVQDPGAQDAGTPEQGATPSHPGDAETP